MTLPRTAEVILAATPYFRECDRCFTVLSRSQMDEVAVVSVRVSTENEVTVHRFDCCSDKCKKEVLVGLPKNA